jgi:transmembrane protein EpsG
MLLAYVVYLSLMTSLVITWRFAGPTGPTAHPALHRNLGWVSLALAMTVSVLLYGLVLGLRDNVGGDYQGYVSYYLGVVEGVRASDVPYERGFYWIIRALRAFQLPPATLFLVTCTLQMLFIAAWLRRHIVVASWYVYFFFTDLLVFESMNTIRQAIAAAILLVAMPALFEKRFLRYVLLVCAAGLIHNSALMFLPLYFFLDRDWVPNRLLQMGTLLLAYVVAYKISGQLFALLPLLSLALHYTAYAEVQDALFFEKAVSGISPGLIFIVLTDLFIMYSAPMLRRRFAGKGFRIYYNLYLIGALLTPFVLYTNYIPFARLAFSFTAFKPVVLSFVVTGWLHNKEGKYQLAMRLIVIALVAAYMLWFLMAIWNKAAWCAPFQFI